MATLKQKALGGLGGVSLAGLLVLVGGLKDRSEAGIIKDTQQDAVLEVHRAFLHKLDKQQTLMGYRMGLKEEFKVIEQEFVDDVTNATKRGQ